MKQVALYIAALLIAAASGIFGVWQSADLALFGLLQSGKRPALSDRIVLVDVPYPESLLRSRDPTEYRRSIGNLLEQVAANPSKAAREVILDMYFDADKRGIEHLERGLKALAKSNIRAYAAVKVSDPYGSPNPEYMREHLETIYRDYLTNFGHSVFSWYAGALWYETAIGHDRRPALPLTLQEDFVSLIDALPPRLMVPMGDSSSVRAVTFCYAPGERCWQDAPALRPEALSGRSVIVGAFEADRLNPFQVPGPEVLAWAVSDIGPLGSRRGYTPVTSPVAIGGLSLATGLLCAGIFFAGYHLLRTRVSSVNLPRWLSLLAACALVATLLAWFALWALFESQRIALPAALPWFSAVVAVVCAWYRGRSSVDELLHLGNRDDGMAPIAYDVFVSYSHQPPENAHWVLEEVVAPLRAMGLSVFHDNSGGIRKGRDWKREIDRSIAGSRVFLPVFTERYFERPQCIDEIAFAEQRRSSGFIEVMPLLRIDAMQVPAIYQKVQATSEAARGYLLQTIFRLCRPGADLI